MQSQIISNGNLSKICSELCSPRRPRGRSGVCFFARSSSPDWAKRNFTLRSLCLCGENRLGFTLMEILIAMFIFAIVVSTIYTSYTGTFRIVDETEYQADIYTMARIALERMHEDLESVYVIPRDAQSPESEEESAQFIGEDKEIKGRGADSLRFVSRAHLVFSEQEQSSGTAEIGYYVEDNDDEEGFVLYRTDRPEFQEKPEGGTGGLVLCDSLVSLNFTYYDDKGEKYDNWDSTSDEFRHKIPKMVSIKLEFENSTDPEKPFSFTTSVAPPLAQGQFIPTQAGVTSEP
jgi:general secretion pathway protein J